MTQFGSIEWQRKSYSKCAAIAIALLALSTTTACSKSMLSDDDVYQAYNSSGTVDVPPYTRTIFSSTNF